MQIVLPPELEQLVQQQIATGKYQSAVEVISAAVKLLEQQAAYEQQLQALRKEARIGLLAAQNGELVDGATAMTEIQANLRSRYVAEA